MHYMGPSSMMIPLTSVLKHISKFFFPVVATVLSCLQILFPHSSLSMAHAKNRISRVCKIDRAQRSNPHLRLPNHDVDLPRHMHDPSILAPLVSMAVGHMLTGTDFIFLGHSLLPHPCHLTILNATAQGKTQERACGQESASPHIC